jgi:acetyltransferase
MRPMLLNERVAHDRLSRICHCDYNVEIALVAERNESKTGEEHIIAVGRISKLHGKNEARFTVLVTDSCQGLGVGTELLRRLIQVARQEKLERLEAMITADNQAMQSMCKKLGFSLSPLPDGKLVNAEMELS